jgi:hypothetical protein
MGKVMDMIISPADMLIDKGWMMPLVILIFFICGLIVLAALFIW